jgi:uncharacterized protein (DUF2249 family)
MTTPLHDFRSLPPVERHRLAFLSFDALAPGEAFELINDHEPKGLLMQFGARHPDAFSWRVLQAQPGAWHIRISRVAAGEPATSAPAGGGCGCGGCEGSSRR